MSIYNNSIFDDIKRVLRQNDHLTKIIVANIAVFIVINLIKFVLFIAQADSTIFDTITKFIAVPAHLPSLLVNPWTIITYMFFHTDFMHILFNMLWLYWMGQILISLLGNRIIFPVYFLGGLTGAVLYIAAYNLLPVFAEQMPYAVALGASAGVLAVTIAAATLAPDYTIHLLFFGAVKLKYLALVSIVLDLISIPQGNAGGHIAHLGGAILGFVFIKQLQRGNDWSKWFNNVSNIFKPKPKIKVKYNNTQTVPKQKPKDDVNQKKIDAILDKISESGYDKLTAEEKEILFKFGKEK